MDKTKAKAEEWFNKSKDWFNKHGVGNLIIGAGGFAAAFGITMQAATSWMGGGFLSGVLAVPIAFTAGLGGAVLLPGAANSLWETLTGDRIFADRTGDSPATEKPIVTASMVVPDEPEIGQLPAQCVPNANISCELARR